MKSRIFAVLALSGVLLLAVGCSQEPQITAPETHAQTRVWPPADKDGTEELGPPSIAISAGTGFVEGGVGMVGVASAPLVVEVPAGATISQVLLYWAGGTVGPAGDDTIEIDGAPVQGDLIGGPVVFFYDGGYAYSFSAYRADITGLGLVQTGTNQFTVSGFDFSAAGGAIDENAGCSILVITDDGSAAEMDLRDGLDMAYFGFEPTIDATVPQVFAVTPAEVERTADLLLMVASVGEDRANRIAVTTSAGEQVFDNVLGSFDGLIWDSLVVPVIIPAGDSEISVRLVSLPTTNPLGASLGWVGAGLVVPLPVQADIEISGTVFADANTDGQQAFTELGIGNVVLDITSAHGVATSVVTDGQGHYLFSGPDGTYTVAINPAAHPESFNADLAASFNETTPLTVVVSGAAVGVDFGFTPDVDAIVADLDSGALDSSGESVRYWSMVFRRAIIAEQSHRRARGHEHHRHHRSQHGWCHAWGHGEDLPDGDQLREMLAVVSGLYLPEPYQFSVGRELHDALGILTSHPRTDAEKLYRELLVTELNYAAGLGLIGETDRLAVLISWGESVVADPLEGAAAKSTIDTVRAALRVFEAINTGGGGGVDE